MRNKILLGSIIAILSLLAASTFFGISHTAQAAADDAAPRISVMDAKTAFDDRDAVFVDARSETAYKEERIKGAVNINSGNFEDRHKELPKDKKLIIYCSWTAEHSSAGLVLKLKEKGYDNAFALLGGTKAWKDAGYPMEGESK